MVAKKGVVTLANEDKILEMLTRIDCRLESVETRLDSLESEVKEVRTKVDDLTESQAALAESQLELRTSVNAILDWTDTVSTVVPIVPKIS